MGASGGESQVPGPERLPRHPGRREFWPPSPEVGRPRPLFTSSLRTTPDKMNRYLISGGRQAARDLHRSVRAPLPAEAARAPPQSSSAATVTPGHVYESASTPLAGVCGEKYVKNTYFSPVFHAFFTRFSRAFRARSATGEGVPWETSWSGPGPRLAVLLAPGPHESGARPAPDQTKKNMS